MARTTDAKNTLTWRRCRGMDSFTNPEELPEDLAADALNVQFTEGGLAVKRRGSERVFTGGTGTPVHLTRFVPAGGPANAELFWMDTNGDARICRTGTLVQTVTLADPVSPTPLASAHTATLNNKLFVAYPNAANRLHVMDAGSNLIRRVGMTSPAAPTAANTGAGTYPAVIRYYRVQWRTYIGAGLTRASNLGPALPFTPSGAGTGVVITKPPATTTPGPPSTEGETHWAIYVSANDATYYFLTEQPVGTLTYTDTSTVGTWTGPVAPLEGTYTNWPAVQFLASTGDRLLGFGVFLPAAVAPDIMRPLAGRVYFSRVINSTDADDEEYIANTLESKGFIDIARNAGAVDRGIITAVDNQIMVAQSEGLYLLIPTGQDTQPYRRVTLDPSLGWLSQWSAFPGEDEAGRSCVYFLDPLRGPYRYGASGLQWLGHNVQQIWKSVNPLAPSTGFHGVFVPSTRECRWWISLGTATEPNAILNFDVRSGQVSALGDVRGGWSRFTGVFIQGALSSVMFSTILSNPRSPALKPYTGHRGGSGNQIIRTDVDGLYRDDTDTYCAFLVSRAWTVPPDQQFSQIVRAWLKAKASAGASIVVGFVFNHRPISDTNNASAGPIIPLDPDPTTLQRRVQRRISDAIGVDAVAIQIVLCDTEPGGVAFQDKPWLIDQVIVAVEYGAET